MAIVFEEALKKNIAKAEFLPVYVLFGEDGFLKKSYSDKIGKKIAEPDDIFNYCKFGENASLQDVYDAAMQFPFMGDKKFIELCDWDFEKASKQELDMLCELLADMPDSAVFVLRFDNIEVDFKKSAKFKKIIASAEKAGGIAVNLTHRKAPELIKMLCDGAAKRGCRMDSAVARYLVETAGDDISLLGNELNKLCAFADGSIITRETVDAVAVKTTEAYVYNLSKLILACDSGKALSCLDDLFFARIEPMIIFHTIASAFVDMFRVHVAKEQGLSIKEVAEKFGYKGKEFVLERAAGDLRKFDFKRLTLCLDTLTCADKSLKSFGADSRIILEQLIIRLIYIIKTGEPID